MHPLPVWPLIWLALKLAVFATICVLVARFGSRELAFTYFWMTGLVFFCWGVSVKTDQQLSWLDTVPYFAMASVLLGSAIALLV